MTDERTIDPAEPDPADVEDDAPVVDDGPGPDPDAKAVEGFKEDE
jgi:hypothetical protein